MSSPGTDDYGKRTDSRWRKATRFGKALALAVVGLGLFGLGGYIYLHPVMERSWVAGVGFYELASVVAGGFLFHAAYNSLQTSSQEAGSGGY